MAEKKWNKQADVIVVGGGGAGFSAAIEAGRAGSNVLILEKGGICGGDSLLCGGMIMAGGTQTQEKYGIKDTNESFLKQALSYLGQYGDSKMVKEMVQDSPKEVQFMIDQGRTYSGVDLMPPAWEYDTDETWAPRSHENEKAAPEHFLTLKRTVDSMQNVSYQTDTEVTHLITNNENEVIGVVDTNDNRYLANKGVILATASFDNNRDMLKRYNPMGYWAINYQDKLGKWGGVNQSVNNTGDGIRMAQEIGADLALTPANCVCDTSCAGEWFPQAGVIIVNKEGKRFVQENGSWGYVNSRIYQEAVALNDTNPKTAGFYSIFDSNQEDKNPIVYSILNNIGGSFKKGYPDKFLVKADTLEELAEKINLPKKNLLKTVNQWNTYCDEGYDSDFGRKNIYHRDDMEKIEKGPFYALKYYPMMLGSFGGLRTNIETQVIDVNDQVIPRLYAAGAIMSGMYTGEFYHACGWSILGTVHWGRKAGYNAAHLRPWNNKKIAEPVDVMTHASSTQRYKNTSSLNFNAGKYSASAQGKNGSIDVTVTFDNHHIKDIKVNKNAETKGISDIPLKEIPQRIINAQSTDVDVISGASLTSKGIINAVQKCINQAEGDKND